MVICRPHIGPYSPPLYHSFKGLPLVPRGPIVVFKQAHIRPYMLLIDSYRPYIDPFCSLFALIGIYRPLIDPCRLIVVIYKPMLFPNDPIVIPTGPILDPTGLIEFPCRPYIDLYRPNIWPGIGLYNPMLIIYRTHISPYGFHSCDINA